MTPVRGQSHPKFFPTSRRFKPGDLIAGKYRLSRQVGAGAMGAVWVARNELLDVDVAVKLLRPIDSERANPNKMYQRLLQEARAAARLGHPAIVRVFDFGQAEDNTPFIVMELLAGESLAGRMTRQRRFDMVESVQLILPVADALATAHVRGIVHRDVKPENIFLSRDEYGRLQPKLVDFGVARFAEGGRSLTRSGALMGTPDYMAPEQARGEGDIDHQVDIWALCIVLYELIAGQRPFATDSANYLAVLRAIVQDPVPSLLDKGYGDPALWLIIERGLRKNQRERWDTMRVLGEALALWLYERGVREDAVGASLKTTWLQSGLDGIKIETASVLPPPNESDPPVVLPGPPRKFTPPALRIRQGPGASAAPGPDASAGAVIAGAAVPSARPAPAPGVSSRPALPRRASAAVAADAPRVSQPLSISNAVELPSTVPPADEFTDSALSLSLSDTIGSPPVSGRRSARPFRTTRWVLAAVAAGPIIGLAAILGPATLRAPPPHLPAPVPAAAPASETAAAPEPLARTAANPTSPPTAPESAAAQPVPPAARSSALPAATGDPSETFQSPEPAARARSTAPTPPAARRSRPRPAPQRKPVQQSPPSTRTYDFGF